ncbi:MAG: hypothetical protein VKM34_06800 [Cyanobacteriota bacterium]|nr:hypothetical protein [Cyanobacteriota bacterium]
MERSEQMPGSSEQREQALRHPLVLGNHEASITDDIDLLAEHISLTVPLRDIMAIGPAGQFRQRSSYRIAGDTGLTAATITPTRMEVEESRECSIVLVTQGSATYEVETTRYVAQAGNTAMFLPGMAYSLESELASGLVYNLSHQLLARYLCDANQGRFDLDQALRHLQRPHAINLTLPQLQPVLYGLKVLVRTIDSLGSLPVSTGLPDDSQALMQLQEGLYALSTALLLPECAGAALASWQCLPLPSTSYPGASPGQGR